MFDRLRRGDQPGVQGRRALEVFGDLLALGDDALNRFTGFSLGAFSDELEDLLQPLHMRLGLFLVLLESSLAFGALRRPRHLRQCLQNLAFGIEDVLEVLVEKHFEVLLWHVSSS